MTNETLSRHLRITDPSPWIQSYSHLIPMNGEVLDLACGGGRHATLLLERGYKVTAIDKNTDAIIDHTGGTARLEIICADLETGVDPFGTDGPLSNRTFDGIVVVNYLYRDLMAGLVQALRPGGVLIYETFALGNEDYARPRNPGHLLRSGELLDLVKGNLQVIAYEHGLVDTGDIPGVKQRIAAVKDLDLSTRNDDQPPPHPLGSGFINVIHSAVDIFVRGQAGKRR